MTTSLLVLSLLLPLSCSKKKESKSSSDCPSSLAKASDLPVTPAAEAAVPVHANGAATTWHMQLLGTLNTSYSVNVYDVDLFDTSTSTISSLKASGKKVVCYFSAGSSEDWRTDYSKFDSEDMGMPLDGWEGERWLDIRSQNVLDIMEDRIQLAKDKGCDGVDPDNMDGFTQDSCFDIKAKDQLAYNRAIANMARSRGLSVGLKNDPDQAAALVSYFDFSVNEQCNYYNECSKLFVFPNASKPIFNIEYDKKYRSNPAQTTLCNYANANHMQTIVYDDLLADTYRHTCF